MIETSCPIAPDIVYGLSREIKEYSNCPPRIEVESPARQISQTARETTRCLDEIVGAVNLWLGTTG
jgi:hypothetical protein